MCPHQNGSLFFTNSYWKQYGNLLPGASGPPGQFSLPSLIKNNKEISSRELRDLQVNFSYLFLLQTIRQSPPGSSGTPRSNFLTFSYSKQKGNLLPGAPGSPGQFALQFLIKNNKEIFSRELRDLQMNFPYNFVLKTIKKSPPRISGTSRSISLTISYSKQ